MIDRVAHGQVKISRRSPFDRAHIGFMALELAPEQRERQSNSHPQQVQNQQSIGLAQAVDFGIKGNQAKTNPRRP